MSQPPIVSADEWQRARDELLVAEKELTRARDALNARRRRLPMMQVDGDYSFEGAEGTVSLLDLFAGRRQLALYQFMDLGPDRFCPGCTNFSNNVTNLAAVNQVDTSFVTVSDMPFEQLDAYRQQNGWDWPFYSSRGTKFSADCGTDEGFGLTIFLRTGDDVFRTYFTNGRGVDHMLYDYNVLDLTPFGRQESWEDSPDGWPTAD
jgi:predicted dithiol-disulfide oxidoreductase (DUF899 family)